ncbi:unnamed protein product [Brachionus calyciflorus]|uniref:Uncharacterized protein n=1 Tax=Brachionus calyciflorus TaxID=104777 RepID=A0A813WQZ1_9BILA|nr:unnamed protein product [Brachionus calyciflorus]
MSQSLERPVAKWQPKRKTIDNASKVFTIKNGKVEPISLKEIQEYKKTKQRPPGGYFYTIDKPESLTKKIREPQTKLWYYDKRNYQKDILPPIDNKQSETDDVKIEVDENKKTKSSIITPRLIPIVVQKSESFHTQESISRSLKHYRFNSTGF